MEAGQLLARNVRRIRAEKGWSQEEAAAASAIHPTYWSQIETGKRNPSLMVVARIAQGLGVPLAELFQDDEDGLAGNCVGTDHCT